MRLKKKSIFVSIALFLIIVCRTKICFDLGIDNYINYLGMLLLLYYGYTNGINKDKRNCVKKLCVVMVFFSFGILCQNLPVLMKINFLLSMFILASVAIVPNSLINNIVQIRTIVAVSLLFSTTVSLVFGHTVTTLAVEGLWRYGFDAGMTHKNYFAYIPLAMVVIEYIQYLLKKNTSSILWMIIWISLIISSNSRSSWLILTMVVVAICMTFIKISKRAIKITLIFISVLLLLLLSQFYGVLADMSETFAYRWRGILNYANYIGIDYYHLLCGNAEMAFDSSGASYEENIRSAVGWDGTVEVAYLNIIIKNGLIGLVGYFMIFKVYINQIFNLHNIKIKIMMYAYLVAFLVSGLFEAFVGDIKLPFSMLSYLILCNVKSLTTH